MLRRTALATLAAGVATVAAPSTKAEAYPNRPINLIVPFAAGGPTDLIARIFGEHMAKTLGQQFIIDNVTGAAGSIAVGKAARSTPDMCRSILTNEEGTPPIGILNALWSESDAPHCRRTRHGNIVAAVSPVRQSLPARILSWRICRQTFPAGPG